MAILKKVLLLLLGGAVCLLLPLAVVIVQVLLAGLPPPFCFTPPPDFLVGGIFGALIMVGTAVGAVIAAICAFLRSRKERSRAVLAGAGLLLTACGMFVARAIIAPTYSDMSPVSLLMTEEKISTDGPFVPFPLDLSRPGGWYSWKASEEAPLIVYDPHHRGDITSAAQLFGTWSFGGVIEPGARQVSLHTASRELRKPWRSGFEALAVLDTNSDGSLRGAELEPLALWFDRDRDAKSRPGEVRPLSTSGVVALHYKPDYTDAQTGDIYARCGYIRVLDGQESCGVSVDWFSKRRTGPDRF